MTLRVVIVGGGYGGIGVAKKLDPEADVVLVEPREAFFHNVAALRALVDNSWLPRVFLPYDALLRRGTVVRDRALEVTAGHVVLASGAELEADVVVLATGSTVPFPGKSRALETAAAIADYTKSREALHEAKHVLLLGAGAVGLELAGEIASAWPDKGITIVEMAPEILAGPYRPELRLELKRQLSRLGVEILLETSLAAMPKAAPFAVEAFTVMTSRGTEIAADLWIPCFGLRPESSYLSGTLGTALTSEGFVEVTPELLVAGQTDVFALGDVTTITPKSAGLAGVQARTVAANIQALANGKALAPYVAPPPGIILPLGPNGGAIDLSGEASILGHERADGLIGTNMGLDRLRKEFGLDA